MSENIYIYQNKSSMWEDIKSHWQEGTEVVFASPLARERFVFGERIVFLKSATTLIQFWEKIGRSLEKEGYQLPTAVLDEEILPLLRSAAFKTGNEKLIGLARHKSGFSYLLNHLSRIERMADQDYEPTNDLEKAINDARTELDRNGRTTLAARQSKIARLAEKVTLPEKEIIFAPLPEPTMQVGGLIKGLSRNNTISLFAMSRFWRNDFFRLSGLSQEDAVFKPGGASVVYFKNDLPDQKPDQIEKGIAWAKEELSKGHRVALAVPSLESWIADIVVATNRFNMNIFYRDFESNKGLALAHFLINIEKNITSYTDKKFIFDLGFFLPELKDTVSKEFIESLDFENIEGIARLRFLINIGLHLDKNNNARSWLDRLTRVADDLEKTDLGLADQSIETILSDTGIPLRVRGVPNSVIVLNYQDLAQVDVDSVVFFGFDQNEFNLKASETFISRGLATKVPKLIETGVPSMIDQSILSSNRALLLSSPGANPLPILNEIKTNKPEIIPSPKGPSPALARDILNSISDQFDLEPEYKDVFSVSELEAYLKCPRGWFVGYRLSPAQPQTEVMIEGELRHFVLENLNIGFTLADIKSLANLFLEERDFIISPGNFLNIIYGIEETANIFFRPDWPFVKTLTEFKMEESYRIDHEQSIKIRGKADRIDFDASGNFFLTDFKSSKIFKSTRKNLLQIDLYPELVRLNKKRALLEDAGLNYLLFEDPENEDDHNTLNEINQSLPNCLGSVYYSVKNQAVSGWYYEDLFSLFLKNPDEEMKPVSSEVMRHKIKTTIKGINDPSTYLNVGNGCSGEFCSHRFLIDIAEGLQ